MQIRLLMALAAAVCLVAACGAAAPATGPNGAAGAPIASAPASGTSSQGPPGLAGGSGGSGGNASPAAGPGDAWHVADIAQPSAVTNPPSLAPGYQCHPCHFLAENQLFGLARTPDALLAVGVQQPPARAIAFTSTDDGAHWAEAGGFTGAETTTAIGAASMGSRTVVVGLEHDGATAWVTDGHSWAQAPRQADLLVPDAAGGMTAVTTSGETFVAGGYRDDPLHGTASAAVWRSTDGGTWRADPAPGGVFDGGRILGIAASGGTIVAVGSNGDPVRGPAGAWSWTASGGWQRARIEPNDGGLMRAVVATSTGFVAVGQNRADDGARSWTSTDGTTWTAAPDQPAFHYYTMPVRMQAVALAPGGLVAGGWRSDEAKGSGVTWTSTDGVTWQGPAWERSFSGGQVTGIASVDGTTIAVGRTGYPDWNTATIWTTAGP